MTNIATVDVRENHIGKQLTAQRRARKIWNEAGKMRGENGAMQPKTSKLVPRAACANTCHSQLWVWRHSLYHRHCQNLMSATTNTSPLLAPRDGVCRNLCSYLSLCPDISWSQAHTLAGLFIPLVGKGLPCTRTYLGIPETFSGFQVLASGNDM